MYRCMYQTCGVPTQKNGHSRNGREKLASREIKLFVIKKRIREEAPAAIARAARTNLTSAAPSRGP